MSNVDLLRKIYTDFEVMLANLHPDFTLYSPGRSPVAGEFQGRDGFVEHISQMRELSNNSMDLNAHTFLANEDWGIGISHIAGERNGKKMDLEGFGVWRFQDGKLIEHWEFQSNPAQWDDFWS